MKKMIYLLFAVLILGCNKKEAGTAGHATSLLDAENPLNKLSYENKVDFYCKMDITRFGVSDTANYKGKRYGFCSSTCKAEFLKDPEVAIEKGKLLDRELEEVRSKDSH